MVYRIFQILIITFSLILFASCLTVETEITLNKDESGTAVFNYNLSTLALDISKTDPDKDIFSFPLMQKEYETSALKAGGIQIANYSLTDDGSRTFINSEIVFNSLQSLSLFTGVQFQSENLGSNKLLTVLIYESPGEKEVSDRSLRIVNDNFSEEYFSFKITIPGDIIRVEGATFSGSEVTFNINIEELLNSSETVQFSVEYR